jgi:hypothetical protein
VKSKADEQQSVEKKEYTTPRLTVHGDLRTLTMAKKGTKGDGTGKPSTRTSGGSA